MDEQKFSLKELFGKVKEYANNRRHLVLLQVTDRLSRVIADLFTDVLRGLLALFVLFFFSLALGFWLSELLHSNSLGFLATGGLFIIFILVITWSRKGLEKKVTELTIARVLKNWNDTDDDEEQDKQSNGTESRDYKAESGT